MIQFPQFRIGNSNMAAGHTAPQMTIGDTKIAAKVTTQPSSKINANPGDSVHISDESRRMSQSQQGQTQPPLSGLSVSGEKERVTYAVTGHRSNYNSQINGVHAIVDRYTGNSVGTARKEYDDIWNSLPGKYTSRAEELGKQREAMESQQALFNPLLAIASKDRDSISRDIKQLLGKNGIKLTDDDTIDFKVNEKGEIKVLDAGKKYDADKIEEVLNSDSKLGQKMLKNSAMSKLQRYNTNDMNTPTLSAPEKILVDIYLKEQIGFGLEEISERGQGIEIWGLDSSLDSLLGNDSILEEQIATYMNDTDLTFEASWTFGNDRAADKTNSAKSLLPRQALGTFAENPVVGTNDVFEITLNSDGIPKTTDVGKQFSREYSEEEKMQRMALMDAAIATSGAGFDFVKHAAERAMEEYLVSNKADKENLEVKLTVKDGQWEIKVEDKTKAMRQFMEKANVQEEE